MRGIIFILFSCCMVIYSQAQQQPTDSLLQLLQQHPQKDTVRLNVLINLSAAYANTDIEKGVAAADEAIAMATQLNATGTLGKAYFTKALNYVNDENSREVLNALSFAITAYTTANDSMGIARSYFGKGLAYFNLSAFDTAIQYHQKALVIFTALKEQKRMANCFNSIGANYRNLSDYPQAIDYYLKAMAIYETTKSSNETAMALSNVGMIYKDIEDFPHALQYYENAINIYRQTDNKAGIAKTLTNMGIAYDGLGDNSKALNIFIEALQLNESMGLKTEISSNLHSIGSIYADRKDYASALPYFKKALTMATALDSKRSIGIISDYIGTLYLNCPDALLQQEDIPVSERFAKALEYQTTGLRLARENGSLYEQSMGLLHISKTYEARQDYKNSLLYYKEYIVLRDSVFSEKNTNSITRKEMQYEFEKKEALAKAAGEKKQALAGAEINRQRIIKNSVMGGAAVVLLGTISSFAFYKRRRDAESQKTVAEFKTQVAETEMKALRAQMNPHFIFNSLNSISDYIARNDLASADLYLGKFAKIMRMILENSEQKEVPLAADLKALELYMQLESARMNNKFSYEIEVADDIDPENTLIPPLILQPFVENSIWHGMSKKQGHGRIRIYISKDGNMINCTVQDNGIGRDAAAVAGQEEKKSLGMKITKARIDIINKIKRSNAGVNLTDLEEGTKVEVKLPLELSF